jgi:cell wall-associated NlpC family hydrolase
MGQLLTTTTTIPFSRLMAWALLSCPFAGNLVAETPVGKSKKKLSVVEQHAEPTPLPKVESSSEPSPSPKVKRDDDTRKSLAAPNATIAAEQIVEFSGELPRVRKLIESALALTTQNLTYTDNSDDPANGGMDCSGFTLYVLQKNGFNNVPRDASGQYIWLRKAGTFRAVLSQNQDTFELDDLRPGDLLFWIGTYVTDHDPPVTHTMIYLGTEKGTKNRIMVGSSDGRSYHGKTRWGVSVFDFQQTGSSGKSESRPNRSIFVGYARPPGLRD